MVAEAALVGRLDGAALRSVEPDEVVATVREIKGLGPLAAELVVVRGANAPDALPRHERRLEAEVVERYGQGRSLAEISPAWRPFRTWAAAHLRTLHEQRTTEISGSAKPARGVHELDVVGVSSASDPRHVELMDGLQLSSR